MNGSEHSVSMGRDEAVTFFRAWRDDGVLVRIELHFRVLAATFRARVFAVDETELRFMSEDTLSQLTLPLPNDVEFRFLDLPQASDHARMIALFYPFAQDPDEADQIFFAEVLEP